MQLIPLRLIDFFCTYSIEKQFCFYLWQSTSPVVSWKDMQKNNERENIRRLHRSLLQKALMLKSEHTWWWLPRGPKDQWQPIALCSIRASLLSLLLHWLGGGGVDEPDRPYFICVFGPFQIMFFNPVPMTAGVVWDYHGWRSSSHPRVVENKLILNQKTWPWAKFLKSLLSFHIAIWQMGEIIKYQLQVWIR